MGGGGEEPVLTGFDVGGPHTDTESPGHMSRYTATPSQRKVKLEKKNKNQVIKLDIHGKVKSCNLGVCQTAKHRVTIERLNRQTDCDKIM